MSLPNRRPWPAALLAAWLVALTLGTAQAATPADAAQTQRLHALFERHWQATLRSHPERATHLGDHRYGDRLSDHSPQARAARDEEVRRTLTQAQAIRRDALSPTDRVSYDVFVHGLAQEVRMQAFEGFRSLSLGSSGGFHASFSGLLRQSPAERTEQVEQILARMAAYPRRVDQEIDRLRVGLAQGWVGSRPVLQRVLEQIDGQLPANVEDGPFFEPFTRLGSGIPAAERQALQRRGRETIAEHVMPALGRLRAFVADVYLPAAPPDGALSRYPGGERVYAAVVQEQTTTSLTPQEIHSLGLAQVARLRKEIDAVMRETGFRGDFAQFVKSLNTDPKFFHTSPQALLAGYREIAKRIDPELPRLFAELPRTPYGVRAMPEHFGPGRAEFYNSPSLDGRQPGWFSANAVGYRTRPIWGMETLVAHETVPGHHLQSARAVELRGLPAFRRAGFYTAYGEGWALYAETLGPELGLYKDPYSRFGHLQAQVFRAARLVVDTGLHAMGWSRQQAIDYMIDNTGHEAGFVAAEIDRYYSMPGQALSYMIGQLKIIELRDRAREKLGERFDIRQFHQVVLDQGALPLDVLAQVVDDWIASVAAQRAPT